MFKNEKCTCKACITVVAHCQICKFVTFLLPSLSWLLNWAPYLGDKLDVHFEMKRLQVCGPRSFFIGQIKSLFLALARKIFFLHKEARISVYFSTTLKANYFKSNCTLSFPALHILSQNATASCGNNFVTRCIDSSETVFFFIINFLPFRKYYEPCGI